MTDIASPFESDPQTRRALELDALAAILPIDRRDRLAELLTDDDVETLKHLAREGMGKNTLRALASDLAYLEAWALAATAMPLPWPAAEAPALKFMAHHLWDLVRRESDDRHGVRAEVGDALRADGLLRTEGPHAPSAGASRAGRRCTAGAGSRAHSPPLSCLSIRLGRTKTTEADDDAKALMISPPVVAIKACIARTRIGGCRVFRAIDRLGTLEDGR